MDALILFAVVDSMLEERVAFARRGRGIMREMGVPGRVRAAHSTHIVRHRDNLGAWRSLWPMVTT